MSGQKKIKVVYKGARRLPLLTLCFVIPCFAVYLNANLRPLLVLCGSMPPCVLMAYMLCRLFKRLPCLTLSDQGLVLERVFSTRRVHWVSLGAFSAVPASWRGDGFIAAAITGRAADRDSLKRGNILLAARSFAGRHDDFAAELNAWRARALEHLGFIPAAPAAMTVAPDVLPRIRGFSFRHVVNVFGLLWLAMLAGILLSLAADELALRATGAHIPAGILGGVMVIGLVAASLAAGFAAAVKGLALRLADIGLGAVFYLLSMGGLSVLPNLGPRAKIGLAVLALLVPICMAVCWWAVARGRQGQGKAV